MESKGSGSAKSLGTRGKGLLNDALGVKQGGSPKFGKNVSPRWLAAVSAAQAWVDPWEDRGIHFLQTERAIEHFCRLEGDKVVWGSNEILVKIESEAFDEGAQRRCFRMKVRGMCCARVDGSRMMSPGVLHVARCCLSCGCGMFVTHTRTQTLTFTTHIHRATPRNSKTSTARSSRIRFRTSSRSCRTASSRASTGWAGRRRCASVRSTSKRERKRERERKRVRECV